MTKIYNAGNLQNIKRGEAEDYIRRNPDFAAELQASGYAMEKLLGPYLAELCKRIEAHKGKAAKK